MKWYLSFLVRCAGVVLFVLAFVAPGHTEPFDLLSARHLGTDELSTTLAPTANGGGGEVIFNQSVFVPAGRNILIIEFSGTGDVIDNAQTNLACIVDGVACDLRNSFSTLSGWTAVQRIIVKGSGEFSGDWLDNNINQTWCKRVTPGTRNVKIKLAVKDGGAGRQAFLDNVKVYIYSAGVAAGNACTVKAVGNI
jgi:hypothetical protein